MGQEAMNGTTAKPWVQFACICEKALREPDNVPSLIRIVDTYYIDPFPTEELPSELAEWALPLTIAVSLKSGDVTGAHELTLRLVRPSGAPVVIRKWPVEFKGDEAGVNLLMSFALNKPEFGLHWFEVVWGEELLARIPLRVKPRVPEASTESTERGKTQ